MYNIASISLFILLSAQLPRTLNLMFENNLVSFEYFSFWQWAELKVCKLTLIVDFYYYFCLNFISFSACFVFLFVLILFIFCVKNYDCFMFIFFHIDFFLVKYLILLMFCFIMYSPTENSDNLRLYNYY